MTDLRATRLARAGIGMLALVGAWLVAIELHLDQSLGLEGGNWIGIVAIVGAALGWLGRAQWALWLGGPALIVLLVVQWLPGPATLARRYIRTDSLPPAGVDAIVVLSASISDEARLSPVAVDRLLEGARLVRQGVASRLVVSRIETDIDGVRASSDADQRALLALAGVDPELHVLSPVGTTRLEAVRMAELGKQHGWRSIVVVTSPTHTRRACATFEAVGFQVTCRPSPDRATAWSQLDSPPDRARAFGEWIYETLGWIWYSARGWI